MEFFALALTTISLSIFLIIIFFLLRSSRRPSLPLPPGSFGLPFIGETLQVISSFKSDNPQPFIEKRVAQFGPVFTTHLFGEPTIFSADPEVNRFILQNEGKVVESSYPGSLSNLMGKNSLVLMKGDIHKRMHSLTMSFGNSSIIKDHLFGHIDRLIRFNMDHWSDRILLLDEAKKITFELALKQMMSLEPGEQIERLRKEYVFVIKGFFTIPVALLSSTYRRAIQARRKVAEGLIVVVRQRREEFEAGETKNDILGAMLAADYGFSDEEIVDFLVALLVGGYETTSTTMTLAAKFLVETPLALAQLKEEHDEIRRRKRDSETLEWSDYKSMPFTQCVINETLRIVNIANSVFRRAKTDIHIKGYTIPKGWKILASFRAVHLNNDYFEDAQSFNPWRWQNTEVPANIFVPFGGGPRLCPGYEIARVQTSVFLHHLVTRFSWVPAEDDKLVFFPTVSTHKKYPINIRHRETVKITM